jgi:alpha-L-rhamnosidase
MKTTSLLLCLLALPLATTAQTVRELNVPQAKYVPEKWKGAWITHPGIETTGHGVVHFRRTFDLAEKPAEFIVNLTADNQYRLYANGRFVNFGPQLSDVRHWRYETVDLAPFLQAGRNVVAVEVINWGVNRFYGIMSTQTALAINGFSPVAEVVNTQADTWKVYHNRAYRENYPNWVFGVDIVGGFYASNPADSLRADRYPWGWQTPEYNDTDWPKAKWIWSVVNNNTSFSWIVEPRNTPLQTSRVERFARLVRAAGIAPEAGFVQGGQPLTIPANTTATLLLDQSHVTIGYPELKLSGGKGATVRLTYAENLFDEKKQRGNRNELTGKQILGIKDVYLLDGGADRVYKPLWFRAFRFVQIDVQTLAEPLVLHDYYNVFWAAPLEKKAVFQANRPDYDRIMDICWRTNIICTQDNFLSDAYYEQMQYVGDTRVHGLTFLTLTGDERHYRNALIQFDHSRMSNGHLPSCYPLKANFGHATFSLIWVDMVWDYMMHRDDRPLIQGFAKGIRHVLDGFDELIRPDGLVGDTQWKYFVDWYVEGKKGGMAPGSAEGNSAVVTLHYVYTLQRAADIFRYLGQPAEAAKYQARATEIRDKVMARCYDAQRGLLAEHPEKDFYDQRANIMAVLTDAVPPAQQKALVNKLLQDTTLSQAGYYYRFNFFNALAKTGQGDRFDDVLAPWHQIVAKGMTTTPERPLYERSEAHPWSTSPAYAFFSVVAGIRPAGPGFRQVRVVPALGNLPQVKGSYPHYLGPIEFEFRKAKNGRLEGQITLPPGLEGTLEWPGQSLQLRPGRQELK